MKTLFDLASDASYMRTYETKDLTAIAARLNKYVWQDAHLDQFDANKVQKLLDFYEAFKNVRLVHN